MYQVLSIMYKNKNKLVLVVVFFSILTTYYMLLATAKVSAADISLGVYPPLIQIDAKAPTDIQSPITIANESDTTVNVKILVRPFTASSSDNGDLYYLNEKAKFGPDPDIFQKMAIFDGERNTDTIELAPNQQRNIELRIHLPSGEPPGDYYFSITFLSNTIAINQGSNTAVAGGISTNVLLSIGPKDKTQGYIKEFSSPFFVDHGPVPFTVHAANTSKHFVTPQGTILIKNMFGQIIGKVNLLPVNVLAGTSRFLPSGTDTNNKAVWGENFLLGPYSATLTIAFSGEGPLYRRTIYFFSVPTQVIIGLILAGILIGITIYRVRKKLGPRH